MCILAVKGAPGTKSLLKVMLIVWSTPSIGTKLTANLADPRGWTCVGMFLPRADMVISRFPSPEKIEFFELDTYLDDFEKFSD